MLKQNKTKKQRVLSFKFVLKKKKKAYGYQMESKKGRLGELVAEGEVSMFFPSEVENKKPNSGSGNSRQC